MKKAIFISTRHGTGGAEMNSHLLASELKSEDLTTEAWHLMHSSDMEQQQNFPVRVFWKKESKNPFILIYILIKIIILIRKSKPDCIIGFQPLANIFGSIACFFSSKSRFIATQRNPSTSQSPLIKEIEKAIGATKLYAANIAVSNSTAESYKSYPTNYKNKIQVIHNGVPPLQMVSCGKLESRATLNLPKDDFLLGSIGRLAPQKNQAFLINLMQIVGKGRLVLAGSGPDEEALKDLAKKLNVADKIKFLGNLTGKDIAHFYNAVDVFLLPSIYEGFGRTLVEAMQFSLPIIANKIDITEEVVCDAGILLELNPELWSMAISDLCMNTDKKDIYSYKSARRANHFTLTSMTSNYLSTIKKYGFENA